MGQTEYPRRADTGFHGMYEHSGPRYVSSPKLAEDVKPGLGLSYFDLSVDKKYRTVKIPKKNQSKIVFDADFVTSNTINGTVNTIAWAEVTFATDHDTTAEAVRAAIQAVSTVETCVLDSTDTNNRTFIIKGTVAAGDLTVTEVVAAGASQADGTITYSTFDTFAGFLTADDIDNFVSGAAVVKKTGEIAGILEVGEIHVWLDSTVTPEKQDSVYVIATGAKAGYVTNVSTSNLATGAKFESIEDTDRAVVRVNNP